MGLSRRKSLKNQKKIAAAVRKTANRLFLEPLEPRWLLDAMSYAPPAGGSLDATLKLQGATLQLINNSDQSELASHAFDGTPQIVITGGTEADTLTIDFSNPFSIPISFDGLAGGDTLSIGGGDRTWNITGSNAGTATSTTTGTVTFTGIENLAGSTPYEAVWQDINLPESAGRWTLRVRPSFL